MISKELESLAKTIDLESEDQFKLRIEFGISCIQRVKGLLTDRQIIKALSVGEKFVNNKCSREELNNASVLAAKTAQSHSGSGSLDGSGNAAVSVSRGVAAALSGRAIEASEYAVYASVYSYASYAVTDLSAYEPEQSWQLACLKELSGFTG